MLDKSLTGVYTVYVDSEREKNPLTYEEKYYRMCLRTGAAAWVIEWARKEMERAKEKVVHEGLNKDIDYYA